jgi:glutamine amidotransferase
MPVVSAGLGAIGGRRPHGAPNMIAIIDYDMGNLKSVAKAFEKVGADVCVTRDPKKIQASDKIVLPGVGAFPKCMENLQSYHLIDPLLAEIKKGKWFLGICLGLQLLFEESEEFGPVKGLGLLKGKVVKFRVGAPLAAPGQGKPCPYKIPHMGWNQITYKGGVTPPLLKNIPDNSSFYFVHSYYVDPTDKKIISTETDYGTSFCSSIQKDNILACQFHPEKSQKWGLKVLENFMKL